MSNAKKIEMGEVHGFQLDCRVVPPPIIEDALRRHEAGDAAKVQKGQQVSHHRYAKVELVVATQPGGATFVMPFKAFREYLAFSPVIPTSAREPLQAEARPPAQKQMDLGWIVEYRLPGGGLPERLVEEALQKHERGPWKEGQEMVSHRVYADGTALTLVTQRQPRVTFLMTCAVYDNDFKRNPLRYGEQDLQHFRDQLVSKPTMEKPEQTPGL